MAAIVRADFGVMPWDVFHQGVAQLTHLPFGLVVNGVSALVLLLWIPLRQRPTLATLANVLVIGSVAQLTLAVLPTPSHGLTQAGFLIVGIVVYGGASALYIGAELGPGPRDGLMTGLAARGLSLRMVRTGIEIAVIVGGWLLGGHIGPGTLLYALAIGPLIQLVLPRVRRGLPRPGVAPEPAAQVPVDHLRVRRAPAAPAGRRSPRAWPRGIRRTGPVFVGHVVRSSVAVRSSVGVRGPSRG